MTAIDWVRHRDRVLRRTRPSRHGDEGSALRLHLPARRLVRVWFVVVGLIVLVMWSLAVAGLEVANEAGSGSRSGKTRTAPTASSKAGAQGDVSIAPAGSVPLWAEDACGRPTGAGIARSQVVVALRTVENFSAGVM